MTKLKVGDRCYYLERGNSNTGFVYVIAEILGEKVALLNDKTGIAYYGMHPMNSFIRIDSLTIKEMLTERLIKKT